MLRELSQSSANVINSQENSRGLEAETYNPVDTFQGVAPKARSLARSASLPDNASPKRPRSHSPIQPFLLTPEQRRSPEIPLVPQSKYSESRFELALKDHCYPDGKYTLQGNMSAISELAKMGKTFFVGLSKSDAAALVNDQFKRKTTLLEVLRLHELGYRLHYKEEEEGYRAVKEPQVTPEPGKLTQDYEECLGEGKRYQDFQRFWFPRREILKEILGLPDLSEATPPKAETKRPLFQPKFRR